MRPGSCWPIRSSDREHLLNKGEKLVLPVLSYLFHRIEQRFTGAPTLLILDEAWVMLAHPVFRSGAPTQQGREARATGVELPLSPHRAALHGRAHASNSR